MEIKKAFIGRTMYDVVSHSEYERRASFKDPKILQDTLIESNGTLYPVCPTIDPACNHPYAYFGEAVTKYFGSSKDNPEYSSKNKIDFSDAKNSIELLEKQERLRADEAAILTSKMNKDFAPVIRDNDSPALKLVKECLHKKHIDIESYKTRFASNCEYSNAIRLLINPNNHNISVGKIQMIGDKFDIDFELVARDSNSTVANPMKEELRKEL